MEDYFKKLIIFEDWDNHKKFILDTLSEDKEVLEEAISFMHDYHNKERYLYKGIYNRHPLRVARIIIEEFGVNDKNTVLIALFHDLLEWSDCTIEELQNSYERDISDGVQQLTWDKNQSWQLFVENIVKNGNKNLLKIKLADKLDNNRGTVFSESIQEKEKAIQKTTNIILPIVKEYYPEYVEAFNESIENLKN